MTVELPHTGLQVPHARLRLAGPGLIALDGEVVAEITLDDHLNEVAAPCGHPPKLTADDMFDYAAACRTTLGDPIDVEALFDFLRAEYATVRALARAAAARCTVAQAMVPYGSGYLPGESLPVQHTETRAELCWRTGLLDSPDGTWWRIYDGDRWCDLDPGAADVAA